MHSCSAHSIRDVKFLTTLADVDTKAYGERLRLCVKQLFEVIHRREEMSAAAFCACKLSAARDLDIPQAGLNYVPSTRDVAAKHGQAFSQARRGLFHVCNDARGSSRRTIWRNKRSASWSSTHTSRKARGAKPDANGANASGPWSQLVREQGQSLHGYMKECVGNWFEGQPSPSLLPSATSA